MKAIVGWHCKSCMQDTEISDTDPLLSLFQESVMMSLVWQMVVLVDAHELPAQQLSADLAKAKRRKAMREHLQAGFAVVLPALEIAPSAGASEDARLSIAKDIVSGEAAL